MISAHIFIVIGITAIFFVSLCIYKVAYSLHRLAIKLKTNTNEDFHIVTNRFNYVNTKLTGLEAIIIDLEDVVKQALEALTADKCNSFVGCHYDSGGNFNTSDSNTTESNQEDERTNLAGHLDVQLDTSPPLEEGVRRCIECSSPISTASKRSRCLKCINEPSTKEKVAAGNIPLAATTEEDVDFQVLEDMRIRNEKNMVHVTCSHCNRTFDTCIDVIPIISLDPVKLGDVCISEADQQRDNARLLHCLSQGNPRYTIT